MAKVNKHLDHLEDRIILEGAKGGDDAIRLLKEMNNFLSGKPGAQLVVTTKWDGAPAVICGTDPSDGEFFVGTKSVFAKDAKICKTQSQIQNWYNGQLGQKLSDCLRYLPDVVTKGVILQGDLMFTNDKKNETIDGKKYITFRPNTITYAANPDTPLGKEIKAAQLGIVFHTKYTGTDMTDLSSSFMIGDSDFRPTRQVWAEKAEFKDISGAANFTAPERMEYQKALNMAEGSLSQCKRIVNKIQTGKKALQIDTEFLKFFNGYVKQGRPIPSVKTAYRDFFYHMGNEYDKVIKKNKTLQAQANKAGLFIETVDFIQGNEKEFHMLIATYMNLTRAKQLLVNKMKTVSSLRLFVDKGGGDYEVTTPEGFVAVSDDKATKLVDRLEFSKLNFILPKQF